MSTRTVQTPKSHQAEAIAACAAGLREPGTRGQCLMACGTGKTLVGYEVASHVGARTVLVLVPSLILVKQLVASYRAQGVYRIELLAVCSEPNRWAEDDTRVSLGEIACETTTQGLRVAEFVCGSPGRRIVVSTYQSQDVLAGLRFDLAIFDEAHRTAGKQGRPFSFALSDDNVPCARRLFMTATPRHAKLVDDGETADVFSMNDEKAYGPVLYQLSMRAAIEAGIICDYKIIGAQVRDLPGRPREVAIRVAIEKAMAKFGIRKGFTFHRRVQAAKDFITGATHTLAGVHLLHVNGQQTANEREDAIAAFREADRALLTNARCLTEGVDLPDADMVAFLDNRKSTIDIVQAVGRASRKHDSKANGAFVFLPVFVSPEDGEDLESAVERSDFSALFDVLQALREQDEVLAAELRIPPSGDPLGARKHVVFMPDDLGGGETDQADMVAWFTLAVSARILKVFRRVVSPDEKKSELLRRAREGESKPSSCSKDPAERALWMGLCDYTNPKRKSYDAKFSSEMRALVPRWFVNTVAEAMAEKKAELLRRAMAGECRPSKISSDDYERSLASSLCSYTNEKNVLYDREFDGSVRDAAPGWFVGRGRPFASAKAKKEELLRRAMAGERRPSATSTDDTERSLARALIHYTRPLDIIYDDVFTQQIRAAAPHWFTQADRYKQTLSSSHKGRNAQTMP